MSTSRSSLIHFFRPLLLTLSVLAIVSISGCGGCSQKEDDDAKTAAEKKEEQDRERKKPDFQSLMPVAIPSMLNDPEKVIRQQARIKDDLIAQETAKLLDRSRRTHRVKPGHWYDFRFPVIANNFDFQGELDAAATSASDPLSVPGTDFYPIFNRPVSLPEGQWKTLETSVFLPPRELSQKIQAVQCTLNRPGGRLSTLTNSNLPATLAPHQHHFVILTESPDAYRFLELASAIRPPVQNQFDEARDEAYMVIPSMPGQEVPLPRQALNWTTIAYLIWDDVDPDRLAPDQQQAMVDWLHFGGQLILSGPDCLERLENSFLRPYLPALVGSVDNLTEQDLAELNERWSLPEKNAVNQRRELKLSEKITLLGARFEPHEQSQFIPGSGQLAIERTLGRGRIMATAFSLKAAPVRSWRSFDSFLNNVLMRRPNRSFDENTSFGTAEVNWADRSSWPTDPMLHSTVRYLSRDLGEEATTARPDLFTAPLPDDSDELLAVAPAVPSRKYNPRNLEDSWHFGGFESDRQAGVGGWDDFGAIAAAARSTLLDAAGIAPPSRSLVMQMLLVYLIVLVPVNWLIFRLVGKVEYAWIAAPLISIAGALLVIRMASLDVGFSRSNIQVGVLELHSDYPRGHLTEYTALYTSLSTGYRIEMADPSAQVLPFPVNAENIYQRKDSPDRLTVSQGVRGRVDGFQIDSNSTDLLHMEQMVDMGGPIKFELLDDGTATLTNNTDLDLENVLVVGQPLGSNETRETNAGTNASVSTPQRQLAFLDLVPAGSQQSITFGDDPAQVGQDFRQLDLFRNSRRQAEQIWEQAFDNSGSALIDDVLQISWVKENEDAFLDILAQQFQDEVRELTKQEFVLAFEELNPSPRVTLGRLFDQIELSLALPPGNYRLFATTAEKLGSNQIVPAATQTDRQTLVVAHLTRPQLPEPKPDTNALADLSVQSDLDFERSIDLFTPEDNEDDESPNQ